MDLLEGLKYGAIGLCVILFIISTRLLSKEQNREDVRVPVLSMIKMFLGSAVFLSLFFGLTEYLTPKPIIDDKLENIITDLWYNHNNKSASDSTLALKISRLKTKDATVKIDTGLVCSDIAKKLEKTRAQLKKLDQNFYSNIAKLKKAIDKKGESINIDFNPTKKKALYKTLEDIFIKLDLVDTSNNDNTIIRNKWKIIKKKWSSKDYKYIYYSDVPQLVRQYLEKFHPNENKVNL